jgi:putative colanic acid biosynthesis acetyltransferase WcaF
MPLPTMRTNWGWRVLVLRVLWVPFRLLFLKGTTRYLSPIRVLALRTFGARIEMPALICDGVRIWYPWNLSMGRHAAVGADAEIYNFAPVSIGRHAIVSQYAYLCTASHDYRDMSMPLTYAPIDIGDHAWVASRAFIGPGVRVGDGSIVGACAVVVGRNVDDWTVVAGNPARFVKMRKTPVPESL